VRVNSHDRLAGVVVGKILAQQVRAGVDLAQHDRVGEHAAGKNATTMARARGRAAMSRLMAAPRWGAPR
jgi:hypothetical protein